MMRVVVAMAKYNTQVTKLSNELWQELGPRAPYVQTRAGVYQMENCGRPCPADMVDAMSESAVDRLIRAWIKLEDEFALGGPARIDACEAVDVVVRKGRPLNRVKLGDLFQGSPILDEADVESIPGSGVQPKWTLSIDGKWFSAPNIEVMTLTEAERFRGELVLQRCLWELSGGPRAVGANCDQLRRTATAKVFDDDLYVHLGVGSNYHVMTKGNAKAWRRAERRGASLANKQVVHHKDEVAIGKYSKKELKCIRGYGFEDAVYVLGERYLIAIKERDPTSASEPLKFGKKYVTNMTGCTLRRFGWDASGKLTMLYVQVDGRADNETLLEVPLIKARAFSTETQTNVEAEVFALKPFYERFIRLYQVCPR